MQPFVGLSKALSQWEWVRTVLNNREAQDLFVLSLLPCRRAMGDDAKACACVVKCLFRGGDCSFALSLQHLARSAIGVAHDDRAALFAVD